MKKWSILLFLLVTMVHSSWAQCAMCKAQLESGGQSEVGNGINEGIIFLMIIPYVLIGVLLLVLLKGKFRTAIKQFINS